MRAKTKTKTATNTRSKTKAVGSKARARAVPRVRIRLRDGLILGPGKIDLLETIEKEGSISAAARAMEMSYRRAWLLVDAMNRMFDEPLVVTSPGGAQGGGAEITEFGRDIAAAYRRIEDRTRVAIREELASFAKDVDFS